MNILATILPEVMYKIGKFPMNSMIKLKLFSGKIFKVSPGFFKLLMYNVKREGWAKNESLKVKNPDFLSFKQMCLSSQISLGGKWCSN